MCAMKLQQCSSSSDVTQNTAAWKWIWWVLGIIASYSLCFVFTELPLPGSAECSLRLWRHRYTWQPEVHHGNMAHEWQGRYLKYSSMQYPAHNVGVALHVLVSLTLLCIRFRCFTVMFLLARGCSSGYCDVLPTVSSPRIVEALYRKCVAVLMDICVLQSSTCDVL